MAKPNIVFILADDLGWNDLGADGSTFHESSNLDRIAREGMRFTNAYATCQVCSPSRASILTGQYPPRHGITDYIGAPTGTDWRRFGRHTKMLPADYRPALGADSVTFAEALRSAGYRTFFAGKWHLGGEGSFPEDHGFQTNVGGFEAGSPPGGYFSPYDNPRLDDGDPGESLPVRLGRETASFVESAKDRPFLAYLSFYSVHCPLETSRNRWEKYRRKAVVQGVSEPRFKFDRRRPVRQVQDCPVYAGMIEAMDEGAGLVLDALDRLALAENTIVIFTSDNGGASSGDAYSTSMLPLRGGKGTQWEGGIREPLYIRYPGEIQAGSECHVAVSGIDFCPTLLDLAGVQLPGHHHLDGLSMDGLLHGAGDRAIESRDLFWHYPHYGNQGGDPSSSVRSGQWKLIHYHEDGHDELYDLAADPGELDDTATRDASKAGELRARLDAWLKETDARFPVADPEYDPRQEQAHLDMMRTTKMAELEELHAAYLDPDWKPNDDWWGSQATID